MSYVECYSLGPFSSLSGLSSTWLLWPPLATATGSCSAVTHTRNSSARVTEMKAGCTRIESRVVTSYEQPGRRRVSGGVVKSTMVPLPALWLIDCLILVGTGWVKNSPGRGTQRQRVPPFHRKLREPARQSCGSEDRIGQGLWESWHGAET